MPAVDAMDEHCFASPQSFYDGLEHIRNPLHVEVAAKLFTGKEDIPDTGGQRRQDMGGSVAALVLVPSAVDDQTDPQLVGETGTSRRLHAADIQLPPAGELLEKAPLTKVPQKHPRSTSGVNQLVGNSGRARANRCNDMPWDRPASRQATQVRTYVRVSQMLFCKTRFYKLRTRPHRPEASHDAPSARSLPRCPSARSPNRRSCHPLPENLGSV